MKGAYALVLENPKEHSINIGSIGEKVLKRGRYIYVGSAFGENRSISSRVNRHVELSFSGEGSTHWHIDYLLKSEEIKLTGYNEFPSKRRNECKVAKKIKEASQGQVEGFGCSDCNCKSHLFYQETL